MIILRVYDCIMIVFRILELTIVVIWDRANAWRNWPDKVIEI